MKKSSLLIFLFLLAGCGLLHEQEPEAPKLVTKVQATDSCSFPKLEEFSYDNKNNINRDLISRTANCFESNVNRAFEKIRGGVEGEISIDELRVIAEKKIIDLPFGNDAEWALIKEAARFLHPKAKPAISKAVADKLLSLVRKRQDFIVRVLTTDWFRTQSAEFKWLFTAQEAFDSAEDLLGIISDEYRLSLTATSDLVDQWCAVISSKSPKDKFCDDVSLKKKVEAIWVLKSPFLADGYYQGVRADLSSLAIKNLIRLFTQSIQAAPLTTEWLFQGPMPQTIPQAAPAEWERIGKIIEEYFLKSEFAAVDPDQLKWAIKTLDPESSLSELSPDLVRFCQRLSFPEDKKDGLHPLGFRKMFRELRGFGEDLLASAKAFPDCEKDKYHCEIKTRQALLHPILKHVAEKGSYGSYPYGYPFEISKVPKRRDFSLFWEEAVSRLFLRRIMHTVFSTFSLGEKTVPVKGKSDEELGQTLDLAYTFLRFATHGNGNSKKTEQEKIKEVELPKPVVVKPNALARVMGLVGDKWILEEGNEDGQLDADEFVSITQFYSSLQSTARGAGTNSQYYYKNKPQPSSYSFNSEIYMGRREFIESLFQSWSLQRDLPHVQAKVTEMMKTKPEVVTSLFHALIPRSEIPKPLNVWRSKWTQNGAEITPVTLHHWVERDAALAPSAILMALDRLILRCDKNEDEILNWSDMECAMPLLLEAAYQTVSSELISLDPGVHDGAKVLLAFLQMKGIPLSLAKLLAANGSISEFNLDKDYPELSAHLKTGLVADWEHIAHFISSPGGMEPENLAYWKFEAEKRYSKCDVNKNASIQGEEWNCFVEKVLAEVGSSLSELLKTSVPQSALAQFEEVKASEIIRVGLKLATQSEPELDAMMNKYGVNTGTVKILSLLENIIRRAPENALAPKDTEP